MLLLFSGECMIVLGVGSIMGFQMEWVVELEVPKPTRGCKNVSISRYWVNILSHAYFMLLMLCRNIVGRPCPQHLYFKRNTSLLKHANHQWRLQASLSSDIKDH